MKPLSPNEQVVRSRLLLIATLAERTAQRMMGRTEPLTVTQALTELEGMLKAVRREVDPHA